MLSGRPDDGVANGIDVPNIPRAMPGRLQFSYTGLHSTVERYLRKRDGIIDEPTKYALPAAFQEAAIGQLEEKVSLGLAQCRRRGVTIGHLVVSGGVASNSFLRERYVLTLRESAEHS